MRIRELKLVRERPQYLDAIEARMVVLFKEQIYLPLMFELGSKSEALKNAYDDLINAIASGQIQFVNGHFEGKFNSSISRALAAAGAKWNRSKGWWMLPSSELTNDMRSAIGSSYSRFQQMAARVDKRLQDMVGTNIAEKLKLENIFDTSIYHMNNDFEASVKGITIAPTLTPDQRRRIAEEWSKNMQLHIQDWTETEIKNLRKEVQANAFAGFRYESMIKTIRDSYGVSQNKAKFLARQETKLLMSKFKQTRYEDAGLNQYKWKCVAGTKDHPVRPLHLRLNNTIQRWDDPPIVNEKGECKHPGCDYGCRCNAIAIVKF